MSTLATAYPARSPREAQPATPHIEIVPTRTQKRARPRAVYAVVVIGGILVILGAQLGLSISLSDGAFQISSLQAKQTSLVRSQQALQQQLNVLNAPQHLAENAQALGMVSSNAVYLRLADGAVLGKPTPAVAGSGPIGAQGDLVPNALDTGLSLAAQTAGTDMSPSSSQVSTEPGAPAVGTGANAVASNPDILPAPTTR